MRQLTLLLILLLTGGVVAAQTTTVTGTAADANGNAYFPGTVSAAIQLNSGQPLPAGVPASGSIGPFATTTGGAFSVTVASPFTWVFTICGTPKSIGPLGNNTPTQVCFTTGPIAVSGPSQSITANLTGVPALGPAGGAPPSPTPGVFNSNFDPPLFQCYSAASGCQASITATGPQTAIDLRGTQLDTHILSWGLAGSGQINAITDTVPYANGDLHTANANWVYVSGTFTVSSGVVYGSSAGTQQAYRSDGPNATNAYAQATMVIAGNSATQNIGPCIRLQSGALTGYCILAANNTLRLRLYSSGSPTDLAIYDSQAPVTGDVLRIQGVGSLIQLYKNNVCLTPCGVTDTNVVSGFTGIVGAASATVNGWSNFQSGTMASCNVQVDSSPDGTNWLSGGAVGSQPCTLPGQTVSPIKLIANFVRVNVTALTAGQTLNAVYKGRLAPSPVNGAPVSNAIQVDGTDYFGCNITTTVASVPVVLNVLLQGLDGTRSFLTNTSTVSGGSGGQQALPVPTLQLSAGYIVGATCNYSVTTPSQGTWAQPFITKTPPAVGAACCSLVWKWGAATPCSSFCNIDMFAGNQKTPADGPGIPIAVSVSNPAAGAQFAATAAGVTGRQRLVSVSFTLTTSATVAGRVACIAAPSTSSTFYCAPITQTATATGVYNFTAGAGAGCATVSTTNFFCTAAIPQFWETSNAIGEAQTVASIVQNLQVGDTITNITLHFIGWNDNN